MAAVSHGADQHNGWCSGKSEEFSFLNLRTVVLGREGSVDYGLERKESGGKQRRAEGERCCLFPHESWGGQVGTNASHLWVNSESSIAWQESG